MAAHWLVLAVSPLPLAVLIALVRGDVEQHAHVLPAADRIEQVDRAHHIGLIGQPRLLEGAAHERLRGHVDDDLGPMRVEHPGQGMRVAHIAVDAVHPVGDVGQLVERRLGRHAV